MSDGGHHRTGDPATAAGSRGIWASGVLPPRQERGSTLRSAQSTTQLTTFVTTCSEWRGTGRHRTIA